MKASRWAILGISGAFLSAGLNLTALGAAHETSAVRCRGDSERVSLHSTERLPEANGTAAVECRGGRTEIEVELDSMKPASLFGGDYNTYVLWIVPPQGPSVNAGELILNGGHASIRAATPADTFAIVISAEPHFMVDTPSVFIVAETKPDPLSIQVAFEVLEGLYNFERSSLSGVKEAKGKVHSEVKQAFTAVRLAQRAGAATLASDAFIRAKRAQSQMITHWQQQSDRAQIEAEARETVRLAVRAQRLAAERALQGPRIN